MIKITHTGMRIDCGPREETSGDEEVSIDTGTTVVLSPMGEWALTRSPREGYLVHDRQYDWLPISG